MRFATFAAWKTATRAPQARLVTPIVDAINEAAAQAGKELRLTPAEALRLAGIVPGSPAAAAKPTLDDIRHAIRANPNFTADQQTALLHVIDGFVTHNSQTAASAQTDPDPPA